LALLVGLMLGAGLALILEQLDESAISPDDFNQKLGVALLGSVPAAAKGTDLEELLTDPKSPVSEAYLSVLTGLHFSTAHGTPKSFLVTSTQPGEGKSTTGLALARSLARLGNKVLIIDGDMRNPSAHKRLNIPNTRGFSNFLVGDGTLDDIVSPTAIPNLHAITSGPLPPNPAELLAGAALDQILARAGERYDHIVIDAPPVLGLADAPLLARAVEATIFILESKRTRTSQALQAINRLLAVQAPIAGAVLTKFDNEKSGYGYGYGYDYSYGH
jgi:capsular exopolysaccharide synthesis family protein